MRPLPNESQIDAITRRLREFLARQPGFRASSFAEAAGITERELSAVLSPERAMVGPLRLIDVVVGVVRQYGIDANWILTGEYNPAWHRELDAEGVVSPSRVHSLIAERLPTYGPYRPTVKFPS
jgi:hypothetical protein